jgi:hypothetical protein
MKKSRPRESFQNEAKEASDAHKVRAVTKILASITPYFRMG